VKITILTPRPDYSAEWRWAFDVEANALASAGADVTAQCWSEPFEADRFDLVLPLVAWGYHQHFEDWLALLDRFESEGTAIQNPVPLLRWNSDKAYLAELYDAGIPTVPTEVAESLDDDSLTHARHRFGCNDLVVSLRFPQARGVHSGSARTIRFRIRSEARR